MDTKVVDPNPLSDCDCNQSYSVDVEPDDNLLKDSPTASLLEKTSEEGSDDKQLWQQRARWIAVVSIFFNIFVFMVAMVASVALNSIFLLTLATATLVDAIDDCVTFWRFFGDVNDPLQDKYDAQASVVLACICLATALSSLVDASVQLAQQHYARHSIAVQTIMGIIAVGSAILAACKFYINTEVSSQVLFLDACMTASVCVVSASYIVTSSLSQIDAPGTWWIDSSVALLVSVLLIAYSSQLLWSMYKELNFFTPSFWQQKMGI